MNNTNVTEIVGANTTALLGTVSNVVGSGLSNGIDRAKDFLVNSTNTARNYISSVDWSNIMTYVSLFIASCIQMFNSLHPVARKMTIFSLGAYAVAWVMTLAVAYLKRTRGSADYRSKTGMAIVLYNIVNFIGVFVMCVTVLWNVSVGLYRGVDWSLSHGVTLSYLFHIVCLISLFTNILSGAIPTLTEFFVEHLLLVFGPALSIVFWSPYNVVFITTLVFATLMSPFLGPYSYYMAITAHSVNTIVSGYGVYKTGVRDLVSASNSPLFYVFIYSILTVLLCIYYVRRRSQYEKIARERTQKQYIEMMDRYKESIKGDKAKQKKLREAIASLEKKGYNIPELRNMLSDGSPKSDKVTFTSSGPVSPTSVSTATPTNSNESLSSSADSASTVDSLDVESTVSNMSTKSTVSTSQKISKRPGNRKSRRRGH
ncbi:hypothetical protein YASMINEVIRUS_106 [Yasminevirus sp. GU-2018]|uniref:Uncharacterized protein n=1 Tax=Yasminevirus sp. GU-2018 TaxID=2420051 RepID=A0A5K0U8I3_9VIRU|nr:hypothetical protein YASMINEVIRUS_106 [Yasminevirus sp. GU-2018]